MSEASDTKPEAVITLIADAIVSSRKDSCHQVDWLIAGTHLLAGCVAVFKMSGGTDEQILSIMRGLVTTMTDDTAMKVMAAASIEAAQEMRRLREAEQIVREAMREEKGEAN